MACQCRFRFDVAGMQRTTFFITGTDTGVGKTVLTALLARYWHDLGINVGALKPVCSGGRDDARLLQAAMPGVLTLDEINPWHFRAPVAPVLAARRERNPVKLPPVLAHIRGIRRRFDVLLVEGAGGLLSPLGENFSSFDLIAALCAVPIVVGPNRLGVINQVLLTLAALPRVAKALAHVILMSPAKLDVATKTNADLLAEQFDSKRIFVLPWLGERIDLKRVLSDRRLRQTLDALTPLFFSRFL